MLRLDQQNDLRPGSPFALAERGVGGRREQEGRANAPYKLAEPGWRQKESRVQVTQSIRSSGGNGDIRLINDGVIKRVMSNQSSLRLIGITG
jgi:hypothetical protein